MHVAADNTNGVQESELRTFEVDDPDFCISCGSILPLPEPGTDLVKCRLCKKPYDINGSKLDQIIVTKTIRLITV